ERVEVVQAVDHLAAAQRGGVVDALGRQRQAERPQVERAVVARVRDQVGLAGVEDALVPGRELVAPQLHEAPPIISSMRAFWAWRRFSASSNTTERGPSI